MHVSLTPELEKFIKTKIETGRYNLSSEVVREALRAKLELAEKSPVIKNFSMNELIREN